MKKSLLLVAVVVLLGSEAWAGHFIDVLPPASSRGCTPVSNGYDYNCSNDSSAPPVYVGAGLALYSRTLAQLQALTPETTGQIFFCSNCVQSAVCISTGSTAANQFAVVGGTTTAGGTYMACR